MIARTWPLIAMLALPLSAFSATPLDDGIHDDARKQLEQIDAQYGRLAAPRSVELMKAIEAAH